VLHNGAVDTVIANGVTRDDVSAACRVANGTFAYEFRVPMTELAAPAGEPPAGPDRTVAVGIQMSGYTPADRAAFGGRYRSRRQLQQRPDTAPPWANAPSAADAQAAAANPAAPPSAPAPASAAPAADATAAQSAAPGAGAAASPSTTSGNPQGAPVANRARFAQPTWFDVTVQLPQAESASKQE
jgi:hypothetical protein